jgi:putative ABC transport system permease protein
MDRLRVDTVHALRSLRSRAGASCATIFVLALGVGLTAAMFALADPFLLRPLPYADPERLVSIELAVARRDVPPAIPTLDDWRGRDDLFRGVAAYRLGDLVRIRQHASASVLQVMTVSDGLEDLLRGSDRAARVPPAGSGTHLVLTSDAHTRLFGGSEPVGRSLSRQDGSAVHIESVLPPRFLFPRARVRPRIDALDIVRVGALVDVDRGEGTAFRARPFTVVARLQDGITRDQAEAALRASLAGASGLTVSVHDLTQYLRSGLQPLALGALSAGLLIMVVCAGNLGNLLLARSSYRAREFATRLAIGGRRTDLVRLVAIELSLLALAGLAIGLGVTKFTLTLLALVLPVDYAALGAPTITGRVAIFALALGAGIVALGLIPSAIAWRPAATVLAGYASLSDSRRVRAARFVMAAAQSAVALVLLSGALLLGRSYVNLVSQDTGFADDVRVASVSYPFGHVGAPLQADVNATLERLRRIPGVIDVAAATGPMVDGLQSGAIARVAGTTALVSRTYVTPDYFQTVGTRLLTGRALAEDDGARAVVTNEAFATRYLPEGAIDRELTVGNRRMTIVGVVAGAFDRALDEPPGPAVFSLLADVPVAWRVNYVVRTASGSVLDGPIAQAITAVSPNAAVVDASPISARLADTVRDRSFASLVLTFFAIAGVGVTVAGLVGIVAFIVARRTREIAIRIALGATPANIRWFVLREVLLAAATGSVVGTVAGRWLSSLFEHLSYGVKAGDWTSVAAAAALTMTIVAVASAIPAARAVKLMPSSALRVE